MLDPAEITEFALTDLVRGFRVIFWLVRHVVSKLFVLFGLRPLRALVKMLLEPLEKHTFSIYASFAFYSNIFKLKAIRFFNDMKSTINLCPVLPKGERFFLKSTRYHSYTILFPSGKLSQTFWCNCITGPCITPILNLGKKCVIHNLIKWVCFNLLK